MPLAGLDLIFHVTDTDLVSLIHPVREIQRKFQIAGLICCGEVFVEAAGVLSESLCLPGPGSHAARVARNKALQRLSVPSLSPTWHLIGTDRDTTSASGIAFPAILKPTGRMSSSGVYEVSSQEQLRDLIESYRPDEELLLESRVRGQEYSIESVVVAGVIRWVGVTAKDTNESSTSYFTEVGHTSPAHELDSRDIETLLAANELLLEQIKLCTGISHAEFRMTPSGPVLMEVAARPPGDAISKLWLLATGISFEATMVALALGLEPETRHSVRRARQVFLDQPTGVLQSVTCEADVPVTWIHESHIWPEFEPAAPDAPARLCAVIVGKRPGDRVGPVRDSSERCVSIVVDCALDEDIAAITENLASYVQTTYTDTSDVRKLTEVPS
ncbi:ATP-grasp domain-containing protein [Arthrobacter sp. AK01]|uniref:ATP-grasp domain-containing protein n=1 Tax=Micrococcaceae TaxID=1268 RepID=UPI001E39DD01|nr:MULTISPECIES: ATP-grasp domain-containing protein [Micrococcaceae]MCD4850884.1 ATP-grasp domain-containing protein [Arthrobacter sp. AK01]MCP1414212.1 biotin carboxylase [Paenarthrobacter sp. A20]